MTSSAIICRSSLLAAVALTSLAWVSPAWAQAAPQSHFAAASSAQASSQNEAGSQGQVAERRNLQDKKLSPVSPDQSQMPTMTGAPTPLATLLDEARSNNPQILAARHAWKAASLVPSQAATLPDPQFTLQQLSVGSPRPFAGFSNSDFAYVGLGVSQDLPYPGKL